METWNHRKRKGEFSYLRFSLRSCAIEPSKNSEMRKTQVVFINKPKNQKTKKSNPFELTMYSLGLQVDILVSSYGACSKAVIRAGGQAMRDSITTPNFGEITVTSGFVLPCSHVIHTNCCPWNAGTGEAVSYLDNWFKLYSCSYYFTFISTLRGSKVDILIGFAQNFFSHISVHEVLSQQ